MTSQTVLPSTKYETNFDWSLWNFDRHYVYMYVFHGEKLMLGHHPNLVKKGPVASSYFALCATVVILKSMVCIYKYNIISYQW